MGDIGVYANPKDWPRPPGRFDATLIADTTWLADLGPTCYICGPTPFVETVTDLLTASGNDRDKIRTERFGPTGELSSHIAYLDGNAAAGELSKVLAMDATAAQGQCKHCGATRRFAEAHLYMEGPGVVARCSVCEHLLLRVISARQGVFLDLCGLTTCDSTRWK
jgi:hypothetical protein